MARLKIKDAPEISIANVKMDLKLPTGGYGDYSISMNTLSNWIYKEKNLVSRDEVRLNDVQLTTSDIKNSDGVTQEEINKELKNLNMNTISPDILNIPTTSESNESQTAIFRDLVDLARSSDVQEIHFKGDYYIANPDILNDFELTGIGSINGLQVDSKEAPVGVVLQPPEWFDKEFGIRPVYQGNGKWGTNVTPKSLDIAFNSANKVNYYVDAINGVNTNNGLTPLTPVRDLGQAMNRIRVSTNENAVIWLKAGEYNRSATWFESQCPLSTNVSIRVIGGQAKVFTAFGSSADLSEQDLVWTAEMIDVGGVQTPTGYYSTTRNAVKQVIDTKFKDDRDFYQVYKKVDSLAQLKVGTWCYGASDKVYVWTFDQRAPDLQVHLMWDAQTFKWVSNKQLAVHNMSFYGSSEAFLVTQPDVIHTPVLFFDCEFAYSQSLNGLAVKGGTTYSFNCKAYKNYRDNLNYHNNTTQTVRGDAVEVNCISMAGGQTNGEFSNNNASTGHGGARLIRIGGEYNTSEGANVIDVNGCKVWNVGLVTRNSNNPVPTSPTACDYYINEGGKLMLSYCNSGGSTFDVSVYKSQGATMESVGWQGRSFKVGYF